MAKYRTKPMIKEASQFLGVGHPLPEGVLLDFASYPYVVTVHGQKTYVKVGDYIVTEPDGIHYYPCKPDIFEKGHELL